MSTYFFVIRTQSIGLYGEPFATGYCIIDEKGVEYEKGYITCSVDEAKGLKSDYDWVKEKVIPNLPELNKSIRELNYIKVRNPDELCDVIWQIWLNAKNTYPLLYGAAYCCFPVETRLFKRCVSKNIKEREEIAPFPFLEIATALLLVDIDPLNPRTRNKEEQPRYNPIKDAQYASHLFVEALEKINHMKQKHNIQELPLIPNNDHTIVFEQYNQFFGIDTKTVGLYGNVYDFAYVRFNQTGSFEKGSLRTWCPLKNASGLQKDKLLRYKIALDNFPIPLDKSYPCQILDDVWELIYIFHNNKSDSLLIARCPFPVESSLIESSILSDLENRQFIGPLIIHDTSTALFLSNENPIGDFERKPNELPRYNPLHGARQATRLLLESKRGITNYSI